MSLTNYSNVRLLLPFSGSNNGTVFNDLAQDSLPITVIGNTKTVTAESKYYGSSAYFDGVGDYLQSAIGLTRAIGASDFTVEFWLKLEQYVSNATLIDFRPGGSNGAFVTISTTSDGKSLRYVANSAEVITGTTDMGLTNFVHVALCRSGTSTKLFLNGSQEGSTYTDSTNYINNKLTIGSDSWNFSGLLKGWMNDLCITVGTAKYTTSFTPPAKLAGTISGTIKDDTNSNAIRTVSAIPRATNARALSTTSAADGTYSLTVPNTECSVLVLDDDAGTLYNDLVMRVIPG